VDPVASFAQRGNGIESLANSQADSLRHIIFGNALEARLQFF
jgi:hypothetical protein